MEVRDLLEVQVRNRTGPHDFIDDVWTANIKMNETIIAIIITTVCFAST
jgi:hypothetical protein